VSRLDDLMAKNDGHDLHQITVNGSPTGSRALIEARLGVETITEPFGDGRWMIFFAAPPGVDLDFLKPDVLEP
jgi:hypothetical protein